MLKRERLLKIRTLVDDKGIMTVNEIGDSLGVSTMTVRRDLDELAEEHALVRIHGGAQSMRYRQSAEIARLERRALNVAEKNEVAKIAAGLVHSGDTIYIGPGTTNELIATYLNLSDVRVVTNSLPVFQSFQDRSAQFALQLIGGTYQAHSGAFIGSLANEVILRLRTDLAFINVNGIDGNAITNASPDEGQTQRIAFDNAKARYVLADLTKLNHRDFYTFYALDQTTALITNAAINATDRAAYGQFTQVLTGESENAQV
ncbi:DeoR/GlpR family DNA-binding transcription regulator [Lacticaseibacillus daqingensis]|uniref:DeoR/GlpR family DNA-binding transcription regulator n=1 Tax=Lacticaseibacillus daqingensis TaxID=2486014 RepID=UPI000F7B6372|nr:DeoR/GlpR family DNA-binding transcription regulator [Lacticaseibacillus daqingensis]